MKIRRGGKWYKVIDKYKNEVAVYAWFKYKRFPWFRKLKLWWRIEDCEIKEMIK